MSTRIVRSRKVEVTISKRPRPDAVKITVRGDNGQVGGRYLTPDEARSLAFYLSKAAERADFMLTQAQKTR